MKNNGITEYFEEVELTEEYDGYFCSVADVITIAILGSICGLKNVNQIHQWAASDRVSEFLKEKFGINHVPCYYWILCLLDLIKMEKIENPLHIISAQVCELGLTLAQRCTDDKSNEIPAVQELLKELNIKGHVVVADALNCQKETAEIIVNQKADYLLCVKAN